MLITPPGGVATDMTKYVLWDQWSVQQELGRQGATAMFVLESQISSGTQHQTPMSLICKPMSIISFVDLTIGETIFAGLVSDPYLTFVSATVIQYWLTCVDFTYYADSAIVNGNFAAQSAGSMFAAVTAAANSQFNQSGCGITADPANPDGPPVAGGLQINNLQLTDAWDQICQAVSWNNDYAWYVDEARVAHFGSEVDTAFAVPSGITIYDDLLTQPQQPSQTVGFIDKGQMNRYEWDGSDLRNACITQGASTSYTTTDTWQADAVTAQWTLTYDLDSSGSLTLTVAGVAQTIEVVSDTANPTSQYQIVQSANGVWSLVPGTAAVPSSGAVALSYTYNQPLTASFVDTFSTAQYAGPNGGIYGVFLSDNTLTTNLLALDEARAQVAQYGYVQERFTFTTVANWPGHIKIGNVFYLNSVWIPDAQNNYTLGIIDTYIVTRNSIQGLAGGYRQYQVTAVRQHNLIWVPT